MVYFEYLQQDSGDYDEYGDNIISSELFKLQKGVIKIKMSGNGKLYCHIPYVNYSSNTKRFRKGQRLGVISLVDKINPSTSSFVSVDQSMSGSVPVAVVNTLSQ